MKKEEAPPRTRTSKMSQQQGQAAAASNNNSSHWDADPTVSWINAENDTVHLPAKGLRITWGNDARFWSWLDLPKNNKLPGVFSKDPDGFVSVTELIQVNWLEVTGALDLAKHKEQLPPSHTYEVIYHIMFKSDAFGWSKAPITLLLITPDGKREKMSVAMELYRNSGADVWHEIHGGEFKVPEDSAAAPGNKIEFGMFDVHSQWWKGGIVFAGVSIRPKKLN